MNNNENNTIKLHHYFIFIILYLIGVTCYNYYNTLNYIPGFKVLILISNISYLIVNFVIYHITNKKYKHTCIHYCPLIILAYTYIIYVYYICMYNYT